MVKKKIRKKNIITEIIVIDPKVQALERFITKNKFKKLWYRIPNTCYFIKVKVLKGEDALKYENTLVKVIEISKFISKTKEYLGHAVLKLNKAVMWSKVKINDKLLVCHLSLIEESHVKESLGNIINSTNKSIEHTKEYLGKYLNELKSLEELNLKLKGE